MIAGLLLVDVSSDRRAAYALFHMFYILEDLYDGQVTGGLCSLSHYKTCDRRYHSQRGQHSLDVALALDKI